MKNINFTAWALLTLSVLLTGCIDYETVYEPNFTATAVGQEFKAGEPIEFTVDNAPDFLQLYSGEFGSEYRNRDRVKAEGDFFLSFSTSRHFQDGTSQDDGAWSLLVSSDYDGSGIPEAVQAATWTDISDRFEFATARTHDATESGRVNISDLASDTPVYFALRIFAEGKLGEGNRQGTFRMYDFNIDLELTGEDLSLDVASFETPGWSPVNVDGFNTDERYDNWQKREEDDFYRMLGGLAEYPNDDWLITNPVFLSGAVSPDFGLPLKNYSSKLESFDYTYEEAGTYVLTLVGNNTTINGSTEQVQELTVTVAE